MLEANGEFGKPALPEVAGGLVSIVICAYNNWPDLELTIESALQQTYPATEVIVVDNSSTDATSQEVPKRFGKQITYISQPNRGDSGAYNTGFRASKGEFLQFLDGDDVLAPNKIEKQAIFLQTNPAFDIVYGEMRHFQTAGGSAAWKDVATRPYDDILHTLIDPPEGWSGIGALGVLVRRSVVERIGPWDESLYISDLDYWLRSASAGCRFAQFPDSIVGFVRRHSRQMSANRKAMREGEDAVWQKTLTYITNEPYRSLLANRLADHRFRMALDREGMSRSEALAKLSQARATNPRRITRLSYALGYAAIVLPGGTYLIQSPRLRALRRFAASALPRGGSQ